MESNAAKFPPYKRASVESLIPYARNSRTHSDEQVAQIAASIKEFGFTNPVLVDGNNGIIAGHGRVMAARKLGMAEVPVIELGHLTETQKRAYIIADNKLALNAGWDNDLLALEFAELQELGFDPDMTGFDAGEIEALAGVDAPDDGASDSSFNYQEQYAVLVSCKDESEQEELYDRLTGMGLECRVLVN